MGEYYTDLEIDSILNRYAKIEEQIANLLGYANSLERLLAESQSEISVLKKRNQDLLEVAKDLYHSLNHEVGETAVGEQFKIRYMEEK